MVLMVASIAQYSRFMRASMLEVVNADYVRTARAKGLKERRVTMGHAVPQCARPARDRRRAEFRSPDRRRGRHRDGVLARRHGPLLHQRARRRRSVPVMAWLMVTATMIIVFNLIADILYGVLDPRVRYD